LKEFEGDELEGKDKSPNLRVWERSRDCNCGGEKQKI
jgi:hypothetical protein